MHDVHLARRRIGINVDNARVPAADGVAAEERAVAQAVRQDGRRAVPRAQVCHAPAGVDRHARRARAAGPAPDRPCNVVLAGRGRGGVDHPLQLGGRLPLYHVHVWPLLRRGVHRAVQAGLDRDRLVGQRGGSQEGAGRRVVRDHARIGVVPDDRVQYPRALVERHVARAIVVEWRACPLEILHEDGYAHRAGLRVPHGVAGVALSVKRVHRHLLRIVPEHEQAVGLVVQHHLADRVPERFGPGAHVQLLAHPHVVFNAVCVEPDDGQAQVRPIAVGGVRRDRRAAGVDGHGRDVAGVAVARHERGAVRRVVQNRNGASQYRRGEQQAGPGGHLQLSL